jgi:hypothetical protein
MGVIYVTRKRSLTQILDVTGNLNVGDNPAWTSSSKEEVDKELVLEVLPIGQLDGFCGSNGWFATSLRSVFCPAGSPVYVILKVQQTATSRLIDPFEVLEVLNRPVTGLIYNRAADERLMQWRVSLAATIAQHDSLAGEQVAVCTEVKVATKGLLSIRGRISQPAASALAENLASERGLNIEQPSADDPKQSDSISFRVKSAFVVSAKFRDVGLVDVSTSPRIDYRLGGIRDVDLFIR